MNTLAFTLQLMVAMILDWFVGDPRRLPHPVQGIGILCDRLEGFFRQTAWPIGERSAGLLTTMVTLTVVIAVLAALFALLDALSPILAGLAGILLLYSGMALGDLLRHARNVYRPLVDGDLLLARKAVSFLVGRETEDLDEQEVARACIESVAENLVDGITGPIFWALIAAAVSGWSGNSLLSGAVYGMYCHKTINTLDSMIGYKNERYLHFGWAAARLDDLFNYLPTRISGAAVICAALLLRLDYRGSLRTFLADRLKSQSPNAAHTEAAVAGALGIRLGGRAVYFGRTVEKPRLGGGNREATARDILRTNRLVTAAALIFTALGLTGLHGFSLVIS